MLVAFCNNLEDHESGSTLINDIINFLNADLFR